MQLASPSRPGLYTPDEYKALHNTLFMLDGKSGKPAEGNIKRSRDMLFSANMNFWVIANLMGGDQEIWKGKYIEYMCKFILTNNSVQCNATTKAGNRCTAKAAHGSCMCGLHVSTPMDQQISIVLSNIKW
jgi:hypothetical protein